LSEQSIFPAIDIGKSLSRVMADVVDDAHLRAAATYRSLWAAYEENRDLILMGAYRPGNDPLIDEAVARRQEVLDFLRQDSRSQIDMDSSVAGLSPSSVRLAIIRSMPDEPPAGPPWPPCARAPCQHALAVADALRAKEEADNIANNAQRLARVREELFQSRGWSLGGSFAAYRELADRLERAGRQLDGALYDANRRSTKSRICASLPIERRKLPSV